MKTYKHKTQSTRDAQLTQRVLIMANCVCENCTTVNDDVFVARTTTVVALCQFPVIRFSWLWIRADKPNTPLTVRQTRYYCALVFRSFGNSIYRESH